MQVVVAIINYGTINDSVMSGSVSGYDTAGIVLGNNGLIDNCTNLSSVDGRGYVGGIVLENRGKLMDVLILAI
jgi:hypothetical protein